MPDFAHAFARRTRLRGGDELTAILAGSPPGVLSMTGGFPNPATFATDELDAIAGRLVREDAAVALQYTPCTGIPSVREYLIERQEELQGRRPATRELMVTSGGMECIALMCQALIDPGDAVAVEAPTYLGALMAFGAAEAEVVPVAMDEDGLLVDALAERLEAGVRPKFLYTIPDYQNPTGRTLPLERRRALVELCRRHGVLILEDVAYRELTFGGASLPTLWSLAPDVVLQAGTFSKILFPGVRLGWAAGPADVIAELAAAKQNTDQCAGGLGQRLVEEYGRAGGFERHLPAARALYASHWAALSGALAATMPAEVSWTEPSGGFLTLVTLPEGIDTLALRPAALAAGVAYVPGPPFYVGDAGANTLRLSFSHLGEADLAAAAERLAGVVREALERRAAA
ncbi:aminotransferase-like domain-containing protein [Candidatus Solirubrobacter pratensis]|uniref:aminotransferase-like domain-containing protein n=1 Tax=Candidatus Solirubrobacter pratensis TaxID=1298857 RepID=UPI0004183002|nr:PLP-dependent aminotransferase family protein [Candidatus Solirubrobacter pratensis]